MLARLASAYKLAVDVEAWLSILCADRDIHQIFHTTYPALLVVLPNIHGLTPTQQWLIRGDLKPGEDDPESKLPFPILEAMMDRIRDSGEAVVPLRRRIRRLRGFANRGPPLRRANGADPAIAQLQSRDDGYACIAFKWPYASISSNVRRFELACRSLNGPVMAEALKHVPQLRVLKYSHDAKWHGCPYDWDAGFLIAHMGSGVARSSPSFL